MKLLILFALAATAMADSNEDLLKTSSEQFTANMFQEVAKMNAGKSVVLSAFSVMYPLGMLSLATVGASHDEILKGMYLPNDNATRQIFSVATERLGSLKGVKLSMANRVYVRKGEALKEEFSALSRDIFHSDVKNIDFSQSQVAANEINTWVEDNTNHRITNLVSPSSLDSLTAAVLVNAIYFKGKWKKPFEKSLTQDKDFHVSKDKTIKLPTMHITDDFKYGESKELDAKLLELEYDGGQSSLVIVLPNEMDGITTLLDKMYDPAVLTKAIEAMSYNEVILDLPKFKIETTTDLTKVLKKMNITKIFTPGEAQLDNLLKGSSDLYVSEAMQKAFIEWDEEGAEAAAANKFVIMPESETITEYEFVFKFNVDRPFFFQLRQNNLPLFVGIVVQSA